MSMNAKLYPLLLEPKLVPLIWGGDTLVRQYGKQGDPHIAIGESWECWDENRVLNGVHTDKTIAELREELKEELMGSLDSSRTFPLLTKLIDAQQSLSVQVHPDDSYARRIEKQPNGKTECWYILQTQPNANLVLGWNRDTSRDEYIARVKDGTLGELFHHIPVQSGDVFYVPAGTLHAIGAGIVLFELQQASDLTYRIFDWNRVGSDGQPRPLHIEKAADVLEYRRYRRTVLTADTHFMLERMDCDTQAQALDTGETPTVLLALGTRMVLEADGASVSLPAYCTALLPAALSGVTVRAATDRGALLIASIP